MGQDRQPQAPAEGRPGTGTCLRSPEPGAEGISLEPGHPGAPGGAGGRGLLEFLSDGSGASSGPDCGFPTCLHLPVCGMGSPSCSLSRLPGTSTSWKGVPHFMCPLHPTPQNLWGLFLDLTVHQSPHQPATPGGSLLWPRGPNPSWLFAVPEPSSPRSMRAGFLLHPGLCSISPPPRSPA